MDFKKLGKALLFPHVAILIVLLPVSTVFLVYSMVSLGTESMVAILSYLLAFYTLTVWCVRIPRLVRFFKVVKEENRYLKRWQDDARLRVNVSLYGTLIFNTAYAVFQLGLGFWHRTFWYCSLAVYYVFLAVMRFFLVRYTSRHRAGEVPREELARYRACGIVFLVMNLVLAVIIFFMVYWNRTFVHHEITTIAMAAYTFSALTLAVMNVVKYRKYNSPVWLASRAISLAAALVSVLTLECTMLTTFGQDMSTTARQIFLAASGGAISVFIVVMAVYMIVGSNRTLKQLKEQENGK